MSLLYMRDFVTLDLRVAENKKRLFECQDSTEESGYKLLVTAEASHSGIVNGNIRFYRPDRMRDSIHTWLPKTPYLPRPVLLNHDKEGDCVGRVMRAKYVDLSSTYLSNSGNNYFCDAARGSKLGVYESVDWIVENLQEKLEDYHGLGYTELGLKVTSPEAIRKIQSGEFMGVSIGFGSDSAVCSMCHTDWAKDSKCEHKMGRRYSGKLAYLITGSMVAKEVSFVNFPADPVARVKKSEVLKALADSLETRIFFLGLPRRRQAEFVDLAAEADLNDALLLSDMEVVTEAEMADEKFNLDAVLDKARAAQDKDAVLAVRAELNQLTDLNVTDRRRVKRVLVNLDSLVRKNGWNEDSLTKEKVEARISGLDTVLPTLSAEARANYVRQLSEDAAVFGLPFTAPNLEDVEEWENPWTDHELTDEEKSYFENADTLYDEMCADGEEILIAADAKLTTEARHKMKDSAFCGPNRSFPVHDCAHVTAARRLAGRAKVSDATRSKILACVDRKAKSLGCGGGEAKDSLVPEIVATLSCKDSEAGKTLVAALEALEKAFCELGEGNGDRYDAMSAIFALYEKCSKQSMLEMYKRWLANSKEPEAAADMVISRTEWEQLHDELATAGADASELEASNAVLQKANRTLLADQKTVLARILVLGRKLTGYKKYEDFSAQQLNEEISALASGRQLSSLNDAVNDLLDSLPEIPTGQVTEAAPAAPNTDSQTAPTAKEINDSAALADKEEPGDMTTDSQAAQTGDGSEQRPARYPIHSRDLQMRLAAKSRRGRKS